MTIAVRTLASNTASTNGATTLSVSPTGMQENDWLIFWVVSVGGTGAHSNTAGSATRVHNDLSSGSVIVTSSWKKKCGAGEAGPYTFDFGGSSRRAVILCRAYSGCDSTDAVEEAPTQTTASATSLAVTGVDPAGTGGLHIVLGASRVASGVTQNFTEPASYPEQLEVQTNHATNPNADAAWFERALPNASATGSITFTVSSSDRLNGGSILLKAGQTTVSVGLATETDSALAVTGRKTATLGLTAETDTALAVTGRKTAAVGLAAESDTALDITGRKTATLGLAAETDTALAVSGRKVATLGLAAESDVALPVSGRKVGAVGVAGGTETALGLAAVRKIYRLGLAEETDTALPLVTAPPARATSTPTVTARRTSTPAVEARRTSTAAVTARRTSTPTVT